MKTRKRTRPERDRVEEGEEPEDPDGTDADAHREDPERAPVRAPTPELAAIAEDVGELEERVPEVEDTEKPEELAPKVPVLAEGKPLEHIPIVFERA